MSAFQGVLFLLLAMAGSAAAGYVIGRRHERNDCQSEGQPTPGSPPLQ